MTLAEAIGTQPAWISWWLNWMMIGLFVIPIVLLIWRESRLVGILALVAGVLSAVSIGWLYDQMGYVKLLGLPHIILYVPLAIFTWRRMTAEDVRRLPYVLMGIMLATMVVSLAFDITDTLRWLMGERAPLVTAPAEG